MYSKYYHRLCLLDRDNLETGVAPRRFIFISMFAPFFHLGDNVFFPLIPGGLIYFKKDERFPNLQQTLTRTFKNDQICI